MAALTASRRLILRSHAPSPHSFRARFGHGAPRRRLVSFRGASYDEGSNAVPSPGSGALNPVVEANFSDEFLQISLEDGEDDDEVMCGISERMVLDVKKSAIQLLAGRAFTVSDLRKKLLGKMHPAGTVDSVIADFKSRGLLNDSHYAELFSRSRWQSSTWGPKRIKQALRQKGVPEVEVDEATRNVFQDDNEDQTKHGISEAVMERLFAQASKQWLRGQSLTLENRRARIVRWLQYRGFNWAVTNTIVRKLVEQHPP